MCVPLSQPFDSEVATCWGSVWPVSVVPVRDHRFCVEGPEGLEHVVEQDVAF
jgi:hypothetical protein